MDISSFFPSHPWWSVYIFINVLVFLLMGLDKFFAYRRMYRIPERLLLTLGFFFGALGLVVAMFLFHHKTRKAKFRYGGVILLIIQGIAIYFLLTTNWTSLF